MSLMKSISAVLLTALLFACGSPDPKTLISDGHKALGAGDSKTAQAKFTEALKSLKPEDAQYIDAKLGLVEALIDSEPKKATDEFLSLAAAFPKAVTEKEFAFIGGQMVSKHKYLDAIDLVHAGIKRAGGESPGLMVQIERIKKEAASDKAVNDKLKGLGYTN
jgi:hypothetical protein